MVSETAASLSACSRRSLWAALAGTEPGGALQAGTVLCVHAALFGGTAWRALDCGERSALELAGVVIIAVAASAALALAWHLRGRIARIDALHPLLWFVPWHFLALSPALLLAAAGASLLVLGCSCGWRALWSWLRLAPGWLVARSDPRTLGILVLIGLMWLTHLTLPIWTGEPGLDTSWQEVKGYELVHGWQVGLDTVFTFGPLGYFDVSRYVSELFWTSVVWWEIGFKLLLTGCLVLAVRRMGGPIEKTVFVLALLLLYPGEDGYFLTMIIAVSMFVLNEPRGSGPRSVLGFLCLALLALVKFTFFALVSLCVALIAVQRAWVGSWKSGARSAALYGVILVLAWTLLGQSPLHLPRYVLSSIWLARGYNEGMSWIGPPGEIRLACWIFALIGAVVLLQGLQRPRDKTAWIGSAVLCAGTFVAWKGGFVRHGGNSITFFGTAALLPFLLPALEPHVRRARLLRGMQLLARVACALLATYGCALSRKVVAEVPSLWVSQWFARLVSNPRDLADLPGYHVRLERHRRAMEKGYALPRIRAAVGNEPVDVFGSIQSLALLNRLNYRPRPVFQSYSAFTPELMELNARFLESERAPRFVLFRDEALDDRLPGSEDGLALAVLMRDYRPCFSETGIILLERASDRPATAPARERLVLETTIRFGEQLDLDRLYESDRSAAAVGSGAAGRPGYRIALDIRSTAWGQLRAALTRGSPVFMDCTLDSGESRSYRVLPGLLRTGALVNPLLDGQDAWVHWYCGEPVPRIGSFAVSTPPEFEGCFDAQIGVRLVRDDTLAPKGDAQVAGRLAYSMFALAPEYVHANPPALSSRLHNLEVLVMQAPAEICFAVGPGKHSIQARFGMIPAAFNADCSDGAGFSVVARDSAGTMSALFHERIERSSKARASTHDLALEFETATSARLLFRIDPGPEGDVACDWAYWTGISIRDAAGQPAPK